MNNRFPNRRWCIINSGDATNVNYDQILENAATTLRYSIDGSKTFVKYNVTEYDPGIESKNKTPEPQEYVVCVDVLEHIEPEFIDNVLDDLKRVIINKGFFTISCREALMILSDGRNAHLIQKPREWWKEKLLKRFNVIEETYIERGKEQLRVLVETKDMK